MRVAGAGVGVGVRAGAGGRRQLQRWNGWVTQYRARCWSVNISPISLHIAQRDCKTFFWAYFKDRLTNTSVCLQALIDKERERHTHTDRDRDTERT